MAPEQITTELSDCKSTNRYLTDVRNERYWVFGTPTGELLVRRVVDGVMKPLRTMQYDEVKTIEGMKETSAVNETVNKGDTVRDANNYQGVVTMADDDSVVIMWNNGASGSFLRRYLDANRIRKVN